MMKFTFLLLTLSFSGVCTAALAQEGDITVTRSVFKYDNDSAYIVIAFDINLDNVPSRGQYVLQPILMAATREKVLPCVAINGRVRDRLVSRSAILSRQQDYYASIKAGRNGAVETELDYSAAVAYEPWMQEAMLMLRYMRGDTHGELHRFYSDIVARTPTRIEAPVEGHIEEGWSVPDPNQPTVCEPPVQGCACATNGGIGEGVLKKEGVARIRYTSGGVNILPAVGDNAAELDKVRLCFSQVCDDPSVKVLGVSVFSYASPEGTWDDNLRLSSARAANFAQWVRREAIPHMRDVNIVSRGEGEDWNMLEELVEADTVMSQKEKRDVLDVIRNVDIFAGREKMLMDYNGGNTYRYMLKNLFPLLRRTEYSVQYELR